jgi:uncharacterized protein YydD (DUF2326 family)
VFLKSLKISKSGKTIRFIPFHEGINLIVDETLSSIDGGVKATGNNVGKTTILQLIDFCLGGDQKNIYRDQESKKNYTLVEEFLITNKILITLVLKKDLSIEASEEVIIERNFLNRKERVITINGIKVQSEDFEERLKSIFFPSYESSKPSFRQLISHNFRYSDEGLNNTLRTLSKFSNDVEYEILHLFLFGCKFYGGESKRELLEKLGRELSFKARLEKTNNLSGYEVALEIIDSEINDLNFQKSRLNINKDLEKDLNKLNEIRYQINKVSSEINNLTIKKDIIVEAEKEFLSRKSDIDLNELHLIYSQATATVGKLQKSFDDLVNYHNQMIDEKVRFTKKELPSLEGSLKEKNILLQDLLKKEVALSTAVTLGDSFEDLEAIILNLNEKSIKKGEYQTIIRQLKDIDETINKLEKELADIETELFSEEFHQKVKGQINKFNTYFSSVSSTLYGEKYAVKVDIVTNKKNNQKVYKFTTLLANLSSGKKQGEISCFDIAYTLFADDEKIPCLHFILNDKKELMHGNQLVNIADFLSDKKIQFIASILKDKLPPQLNKEEYFIVKLSQGDRLFRIEQNTTQA